jgi:AAA domain
VAALKEALIIKKYPAAAVSVMALYPDKFMQPELLQFWEGKSGEVIS